MEICESTLTLSLPNTTRIFMPNFDPLNASAMTGGAIFGRSPNYVRIESCSKIAWNRTRSVLPYNTIVTDVSMTYQVGEGILNLKIELKGKLVVQRGGLGYRFAICFLFGRHCGWFPYRVYRG